MTRQFQIKLDQDAETYVAYCKEETLKKGNIWKGDATKGEFGGSGVLAIYTISGDMMDITITKKPMPLPWPMVEKAVRALFD